MHLCSNVSSRDCSMQMCREGRVALRSVDVHARQAEGLWGDTLGSVSRLRKVEGAAEVDGPIDFHWPRPGEYTTPMTYNWDFTRIALLPSSGAALICTSVVTVLVFVPLLLRPANSDYCDSLLSMFRQVLQCPFLALQERLRVGYRCRLSASTSTLDITG